MDQGGQELPAGVRSDQIQSGRESLVLVSAVAKHDNFPQEAGGPVRVSLRSR